MLCTSLSDACEPALFQPIRCSSRDCLRRTPMPFICTLPARRARQPPVRHRFSLDGASAHPRCSVSGSACGWQLACQERQLLAWPRSGRHLHLQRAGASKQATSSPLLRRARYCLSTPQVLLAAILLMQRFGAASSEGQQCRDRISGARAGAATCSHKAACQAWRDLRGALLGMEQLT